MGLMKMLLLFNKTNLRRAITSETIDVLMEIIRTQAILNCKSSLALAFALELALALAKA